MEALDRLNKALEDIYGDFEFQEQWHVFPIDDSRKYYWHIDNGEVKFYDSIDDYKDENGDHTYTNEIISHRHHPKSVWESTDGKFTMILVDTHTDGNRFLQIFDNSKKII